MTPWVIYYRFHSNFGFDRFVKILESRKHFFTLRPQNSPNDPQNCYIMCVMWHSAACVPVLSFGVEKTGYAPVSRERSDYATVPWGNFELYDGSRRIATRFHNFKLCNVFFRKSQLYNKVSTVIRRGFQIHTMKFCRETYCFFLSKICWFKPENISSYIGKNAT